MKQKQESVGKALLDTLILTAKALTIGVVLCAGAKGCVEAERNYRNDAAQRDMWTQANRLTP